MKHKAALVWCALLSGCASTSPDVVVQKVDVPVLHQIPCPAPSVPAPPAYVQPTGSPSEIIKALVLDFGLALGDSRALRAQLDARPATPPANTPQAPAK